MDYKLVENQKYSQQNKKNVFEYTHYTKTIQIIIFDYINRKQEVERKDKTTTLYFKENTIFIINVNQIDRNLEIV